MPPNVIVALPLNQTASATEDEESYHGVYALRNLCTGQTSKETRHIATAAQAWT